jgi:hypothetical protein
MSRVSLVWRRPSWEVASAVPGLDQAHPIGGGADIELFPDGIAVSALRPATPRPRSPSPVRSQPRAPVQPGRLRPFGLVALAEHRQVA